MKNTKLKNRTKFILVGIIRIIVFVMVYTVLSFIYRDLARSLVVALLAAAVCELIGMLWIELSNKEYEEGKNVCDTIKKQ